MNDTHKRQAGFTVVEMLIIFSITMVLFSMSVTLTRTAQSTVVLFREHSLLMAQLERAKSFALQTYLNTSEQPCGYGIALDPSTNSYILFEDKDPIDPLSPNCLNANHVYDVGEGYLEADGSLARTYLAPEIIISALLTTVSDIVYVPPEPLVYINGGGTTGGYITLETAAGGHSMQIFLNDAGGISE